MDTMRTNMAGRWSRRLWLSAALLGAVVGSATDAAAASALLRWMPRGSASIVRYDIYVRSTGTVYGTVPKWSGNPTPASDGSLSAVVPFTPPATGANYFAVVAVTSTLESALSQELYLGTPVACRADACTTKTTCNFSNLPDGTSCDDASFCNGPEVCRSGVCDTSAPRDCSDNIDCSVDSCDDNAGQCIHDAPPGCCLACDSGDPCLADACAQGDCRADAGTPIEVDRIRLMNKAAGIRLAAKGKFTADPTIDASATGATIELRGQDGHVVYSSTIPPNYIKPGTSGHRYRLAVTRAQSELFAGGITRLDFRIKGDRWQVTMKIESTVLEEAFHEPLLTWLIRLGGDACMRAVAVPCSQVDALSICR